MQELSKAVVPEHEKGKRTDIESTKTMNTRSEALQEFDACKQRLLNVNNWSRISGKGSATFNLTDGKGIEIDKDAVEVGDYFKIDVPGPGTATGDGFDWVHVEKVETLLDEDGDKESLVITVRPATNPQNRKEDIAHFFTDEATSSFVVERSGLTITAGVHGRNEKPNTDAEAATDMARNVMMAFGAIVGFSEAQWKKLVDGILNKA